MMPDSQSTITLRGLARPGAGAAEYLRNHFGLDARVCGEDLVLDAKSCGDAFHRRHVLQLHPRMPLRRDDYADVAARLYAQVPNDLKAYQPAPPESIRISRDFGLISQAEEALAFLVIAPDSSVTQCLREKVLPCMVEGYNSKYVTGVSVDSTYQQACISMSKMGVLAQLLPPGEIVNVVTKDSVMGGALPDGIDPLGYLDALMRFSPVMFTIPIQRQGVCWHFQADGMYSFGSAPVSGVVQLFATDFSPLADSAHYLGLAGLKGMNGKAIFRMLRMFTDAINRLMAHLNDLRTFVYEGGDVNFLQRIQSYSAIQLLFADIHALNYSTNAHNRISYAMPAMDKLTNMRATLGRLISRESLLMQGLASMSQREQLKRCISVAAMALDYRELAESLNNMVDRCYEDLHEQLANQCGANASEADRLERIWMQRNIRHGAFLNRNQFERLFLKSSGSVASTIGTLPYLLTLGLLCDPEGFLRFEPVISS